MNQIGKSHEGYGQALQFKPESDKNWFLPKSIYGPYQGKPRFKFKFEEFEYMNRSATIIRFFN